MQGRKPLILAALFVAALVAGMVLHDRGLAGRETAAPKA